MTYNYSNNPYGVQSNTQYHHHHRKKYEDSADKVAISAAGLGVATLGIQKASEFLAAKLMQGEEFTTHANVNKVAESMIKDHGLQDTVKFGYVDKNNVDTFVRQYGEGMAGPLRTVAEGKNAFYVDEFKLAVAPKSKPSLMLHELGHSINANKSGVMKVLQKTRGLSAFAPAAIAFLAPFFQSKNEEGTNLIKDNAGLLGFAAFLPTIIEEGVASLRGIKAAAKKLPGVDLKHLKRNYAFAWGTYVLAGIGLGIGSKMAVLQEHQNN